MSTTEARNIKAAALALAWIVAALFVNGLALLLVAGIAWLLIAGVQITELPDGIAELEAYANEKGSK